MSHGFPMATNTWGRAVDPEVPEVPTIPELAGDAPQGLHFHVLLLLVLRQGN